MRSSAPETHCKEQVQFLDPLSRFRTSTQQLRTGLYEFTVSGVSRQTKFTPARVANTCANLKVCIGAGALIPTVENSRFSCESLPTVKAASSVNFSARVVNLSWRKAGPSVEDHGVSADVLVIDDSDIVRECIVDALKAAGYKVVSLPSPIGATSVVLRNAVKCVVLDVQMPSMRGDTLAAIFRKNTRLRGLKVVLASSIRPEQLQKLGEETRADAIVDKSHGVEQIVRTVTRLLQTG